MKQIRDVGDYCRRRPGPGLRVKEAVLRPGALLACCVGGGHEAIGQSRFETLGAPTLIVTAQKREQAIEDVPASLFILSDAEDASHLEDPLASIARLVPNVAYLPGGFSGYGQLSIRGLYSGVGSPTVTLSLDEAPLHMRPLDFAGSIGPELLDLERVEVLRGPQGTLLGASALGGAINFVSNQPSLTEWSGWGRTTLSAVQGGGVGGALSGAVGGPLVDNRLGARLAFRHRRVPGYIDRLPRIVSGLTQTDINEQESTTARAAVRFSSGRLSLRAMVQVQALDSADLPIFESSLGPFRQRFVVRQPGSDDLLVGQLRAGLDLEEAELVALASRSSRRFGQITDYSTIFGELVLGGAVPGLVPPEGTASRIRLTQDHDAVELRASSTSRGPFDWLLGAAYTRSRLGFRQDVLDPGLTRLVADQFGASVEDVFGVPLLPGDISYAGEEDVVEQQWAVFGEVTWKASPNLSLFAGLRAARSQVDLRVASAGPFTGVREPIVKTVSSVETPLSPRIGATYRLGDATRFYATLSRGYRAGGGNTPVPVEPCRGDLGAIGREEGPASYRSDAVWSWEAGMRSSLSNRTSLRASLFRIDWSDIQQAVQLPTCGFSFVDNLGSARNQGVELELTSRFDSHLTFSAAAGFVDARFRKSIDGGVDAGGLRRILVGAGDLVPFTPRWSASGSLEYRRRIGRWPGDVFARAALQATGPYRRTIGPGSVSHDPRVFFGESYTHGAVTLGFAASRWTGEVTLGNVFDARPILFNSAALVPATGSPLRQTSLPPRQLQVVLGYRF